MKCVECGHEMEYKRKKFVAELDNCVLIIKGVPSNVCPYCGEVYYDDAVATKIESIIDQFKSIIQEVAIIEYNKVA